MSVPDSAGCIVRLLDQGVLRAAERQNVAALIRIITLQRSQHDIPASAKQWHLETTRESNKNITSFRNNYIVWNKEQLNNG